MVSGLSGIHQLTVQGELGPFIAQRMSLSHLKHIPQAKPLRDLLRIWLRAKLTRNALPGHLPVAAIRDCQMLQNFHIYDVSRPSLADTFVSVWGTHATIYSGASQASETLRAIGNDSYREWIIATLFLVKSQGLPYLEEVVAQQMPMESDTSLSRYRLLLPLSSDGDQVNRVMMAWAFVRPTLASI